MLLMGSGLGLTTAPATESILSVLPPAKAGVGSAVNDATREVGGTLGVAIVGSVYTSLYGSHLLRGAAAHLPAAALHTAKSSVGAGYAVAGHVPAALHTAVLHGLASGRLALITVTGRRTGARHTFPVGYSARGDRVTIPVGWPERKVWWRNLRGGAPVELLLHGQRRRGHAEVHGSEASPLRVDVQLEPRAG